MDEFSRDIGISNSFDSISETLFISNKATMAELSSSIYNSIMSTCTTRQHERENGHVHSFSDWYSGTDCFKHANDLMIYYTMNILCVTAKH